MKIAFVFPHFLSPGGAARVVLEFTRALQKRQHTLIVCCAKVSEHFKDENPDIQFIELQVPPSNSLTYWLLLPFWQGRINRRLRPYQDFILCPHVLPSNWWVWKFKRSNKNVKVVWYCHEPSSFIHSRTWINAIKSVPVRLGAKLFNPFLKRVDIALEKQNDLIICNSDFTKHQYKKVYGREAQAVIYPPCNILPVSLETNKENFILTAARLSKFKNIDLLITAFSKVSKELPDVHLIIVGDGEESKNLQHLAFATGVMECTHFEGTVTDDRLEYLYTKAMVTIICSKDEPFGLVAIESMKHGTPVIAHNSGGPQETISTGSTGFLFNTEDELVTLIKGIFELDGDKYRLMQQNCIEQASKYDISNAVLALEQVLQSL